MVTVLAFLLLALAAGLLLLGCGGESGGPPGAEKGTIPPSTRPSGPATSSGNKVLVVVADKDFQDTEYEAVKNALGAAGFEVVVANASGATSVGSNGAQVLPDLTVDKAKASDYKGVVIIGGPGASQYYDDAALRTLVTQAAGEGKVVAAICIAPVVLANAGVLKGKKATVFPDEKAALAGAGAVVQDATVVVDGNIVTGNGPESSDEFSKTVVNALKIGTKPTL